MIVTPDHLPVTLATGYRVHPTVEGFSGSAVQVERAVQARIDGLASARLRFFTTPVVVPLGVTGHGWCKNTLNVLLTFSELARREE